MVNFNEQFIPIKCKLDLKGDLFAFPSFLSHEHILCYSLCQGRKSFSWTKQDTVSRHYFELWIVRRFILELLNEFKNKNTEWEWAEWVPFKSILSEASSLAEPTKPFTRRWFAAHASSQLEAWLKLQGIWKSNRLNYSFYFSGLDDTAISHKRFISSRQSALPKIGTPAMHCMIY